MHNYKFTVILGECKSSLIVNMPEKLGITNEEWDKYSPYWKRKELQRMLDSVTELLTDGDYKEMSDADIVVDDLTEKWGYSPERRDSNVAGSKPISPKQFAYCQRLYNANQVIGDELSLIINQTWGLSDMKDWKSADAMFFINAFKKADA